MEKLWYPRKRKEKQVKLLKKVPGYIYLVQICNTGLCKIGITKSLKERMRALKTGLPFELVVVHTKWYSDCKQVERHLHQQFQDRHHDGEWFKLSSTDIDYIKSFDDGLGVSKKEFSSNGMKSQFKPVDSSS